MSQVNLPSDPAQGQPVPSDRARRPDITGGAHPAAHTVREALLALATEAVVTRILRRALHIAQEQEIPQGGSRLQRFVERHLAPATSFVLGTDASTALLDQLAPLLGRMPSLAPHAPSRARLEVARGLRGPGTEPAPALSSALAASIRPELRVLFATLDEEKLQALRTEMRGEAAIQGIEDVVALLDAIQAAAQSDDELTIIVDCLDPSVQPATLATVAAELPPSAVVLLWGADDAQEREAKLLVEDSSNWLTCSDDASTADLGTLLRSLA